MTAAPPGVIAAMPQRGAADDPRDLILCLSHLRWDFVFQRPQHLLSRAARASDVLFVEEPVFRPDIAEAQLDLRSTPAGVTVAVPTLPDGMAPPEAEAAQRSLLAALLQRRGATTRRLIGWFYTPMAMAFADDIAFDLVVYDCMDELSLFRGAPPRILELEQRLLDRADLVFTGGRSLFEAKRGRHPSVHCFPSSIDAAHFGVARLGQAEDPPGEEGVPHPRIGFFGVIDERTDLGLVEAIATARPDWSLMMVGPVVKIDAAALPRRPNIHWLGGRRYADLPAHLAAWNAGFMPFALNESTRFISPTKTPEFLAAGLPLVSTPIIDVVRDWGPGGADLVSIAQDAPGFVRALDALLAQPERKNWLARVDRALARQSWDRTWAGMAALIAEAFPEEHPVARRSAG